MVKQESTTLTHLEDSIEWIQVITLDSKNRLFIWTEWKKFFPELSEVKLLFSGNYAIILSKSIYEDYFKDPELIIHTIQIDKNSRILFPKNFLSAYSIVLEKQAYLIGKGNHIEIYFQKEKFEEMKNRALQAATQLQVNLLLTSKNNKV